MPAGPPCFAKKAEACAADPSRASQYKYVPKEICERFGLPPGACVCKSKHCWRVFGMADDPKPPGRPSAAVKRAREDCLTPVSNVSTASRSKPALVVKIHSFKDARCRPPSATLLAIAERRPRMLTVEPVCRRCTTVDFERPTSDESIVEARRDALPADRSKTLEYAVHGKFRMREGGPAFPDTFWLSPRELKACGCSSTEIRQAAQVLEESLAMAGEEACEGLSSEEESEEEEDARAEGQGEEQAEVDAEAEVEAEAEAEAVAAVGDVLQPVLQPVLVAYS